MKRKEWRKVILSREADVRPRRIRQALDAYVELSGEHYQHRVAIYRIAQRDSIYIIANGDRYDLDSAHLDDWERESADRISINDVFAMWEDAMMVDRDALIAELRKDLELARSFHKVAVSERDYERLRNDERRDEQSS